MQTWWASIFVGSTEGYDGQRHQIGEIEWICRKYCDEVGLCVTVTPTKFVYKDGDEPGAIVGLIQYPRFPKSSMEIRRLAMTLGERLRAGLKQIRVTVQMPEETILLGDKETK